MSVVCLFLEMFNYIYILIITNYRRTKLTEIEHELVIKTLCSYFNQMKPQEIPPLLQQILHFCSDGDFLNLFCTLQKYFDNKYNLDQSNEHNNSAVEIGTML